MDRVFLDANVLFSAAHQPTSSFRKLWTLADVELLTSIYAAEEARRNLAVHRPDRLPDFEQLVNAVLVVTGPTPDAALPEGIDLEAKDQPILLAAIEAKATHLVTGDKTHFGHYFGQTVAGVLIVRPGEYLRGRSSSG